MGLIGLIFWNKKGEKTFVPSCEEHVVRFIESDHGNDTAYTAYQYMKENDLFNTGFFLALAPMITWHQEQSLLWYINNL